MRRSARRRRAPTWPRSNDSWSSSSGRPGPRTCTRARGSCWAAFEIKLGQGRVEEAAKTLLAFAERIDTGRCGAPAALAVITSGGYGYRRPDGVAVIPVGELGP